MVKDIIKYSGLFIMLIGIIILVISFLSGIRNNAGLIVSLLMIISGFILFLLTNRYIDE